MKAKDLENITEETKRIIQEYLNAGNTVNSLAVEADLHPSQIWLFMRNERGLTDKSLQKIGKAINENS
jgi:transposase-like protein